MGICLSARIKAESSSNTGVSSKYLSSNVNDTSGASGSSSKGLFVPIPSTPQSEDEIIKSANLKKFSFAELKMATRNFRPDSMLGVGGFGSVFKGCIDEHSLTASKPSSGKVIAVKRLNPESFQGHQEWLRTGQPSAFTMQVLFYRVLGSLQLLMPLKFL